MSIGPELAAALVEAQTKFDAIPKTASNPFFKSKYADLATVVAAAQPVLTVTGLAVSQFPTITPNGEPGLTTILLHKSGQYIESTMPLLAAPNKGGEVTPQEQGSAITYARRYAFMAVLGLVADEDDDGNAASKSKAPVKAALRPAQAPQKAVPLDALAMAKNRLREAVKAAGLNGSEYAWVKDATDKDIKAIHEQAEAAENLAKAGLLPKG